MKLLFGALNRNVIGFFSFNPDLFMSVEVDTHIFAISFFKQTRFTRGLLLEFHRFVILGFESMYVAAMYSVC